ncbi:MAG: DUF4350 domain-containing protein [Chloroflexi bacterium]|nr:DUF4350 domain-containing protein [Chloroflexota bacterium]
MRGLFSSRGGFLLAGLLLGFVVLVVLAQLTGASAGDDDQQPPLSIHSSSPEGARALYLWLQQSSVELASIELRPFEVDADTDMLFVLQPTEPFHERHLAEVLEWVDDGGTLVVVADQPNSLLSRLDAQVEMSPADSGVTVLQPFFEPTPKQLDLGNAVTLRLRRSDWVPLIGAPNRPDEAILAVRALGRGRVYAASAPRLFSNAGIGQAENWLVLHYLLAGASPSATIVFDEYHHGLNEYGTLGARLLREPWGWALMYVAVTLFVFLALSGRRFGRALPAPHATQRRSRAEYVATVAALLRRANHQTWLREQYVGQLRRSLAAHFRVRPDLPAADLVAELASRRSEATALAEPLARLESQLKLDERTVVSLIRDLDRVRERLLAS